jgi:hypothetical protein
MSSLNECLKQKAVDLEPRRCSGDAVTSHSGREVSAMDAVMEKT